jgi:hypothetical protein
MPSIQKLFELAKQCYAQANGTLNPKAKETLQDMGDQYMQKADKLRRIEFIQAVFPNDIKVEATITHNRTSVDAQEHKRDSANIGGRAGERGRSDRAP